MLPISLAVPGTEPNQGKCAQNRDSGSQIAVHHHDDDLYHNRKKSQRNDEIPGIRIMIHINERRCNPENQGCGRTD